MSRAGMSLMEVMVALVILAIAVMCMMGNIATLDHAHHSAKETAGAQQLAQLMAERFQGADWHALGQTSEPWSLHRSSRTTAPAPSYPPMTETDAVNPTRDNLRTLGLLSGPSGLNNLKVYVEYYAMGMFQDAAGAWLVNSGSQYRARLADPTLRLAETGLDLTNVSDAVIIRVLLTWNDLNGGSRRHELVFARRK